MVHLRRGLVEDANFYWVTKDKTEQMPLPDAAWDVALVFDTKQNSVTEQTVVVIDFAENSQEANLTVAGRPGRVALVAEMAKGLKTWVESTMASSSLH